MQKYYPHLFILGFSLLASSYAVANNQCVQIQNQAKQAYEQNNVPQLQRSQQQMRSSDCAAAQKTYVERQLAYAMYNDLAQKRVQGEVLVKGMKQILRQNNSFWPALVALGDHYHEVKKFNQSTSYYSKAVDAINDETKTLPADAPSLQTIKTLVKNSELDLLAADTPPPASRGNADGLMGFKVRSVSAVTKQLPIHFDSGRKNLSGSDLDYAKRLYRVLHKKGEPNIRLIGHTDGYQFKLGHPLNSTAY